jgi:hypothetical protein
VLTTSSLLAGVNTITAQYTGDTNYIGSAASPVTVTIDPDFTFAATNNSVSVAQGGSTTDVLTITGQAGYNNTVNFTSASCSGLPNLTTCSFSPASVVGTGTTTVTLRTTAPSSAALRGAGFTTLGFVFAGILLMGVPSRRFRSGAALSVILCTFAIGSMACGGGSTQTPPPPPNPGTPKGTYNISVTATTSDQVISHTSTFTLVVQ